MKTIFLTRLLFALLAFCVINARAQDEQTYIDTLRSDAGVAQKWAACQKLRVIGTAKSVPAVAALLTDERLSQAARHTLEGLSYPEVDAALSEALGKTSGPLKAGIVDSLGWRGKPSALPLLIPLVSNSDATVAAAAAAALGRIGGPDAVAALVSVRDQPPAAVQAAALASLLQCAERLAAANDGAGAAGIYHALNDEKYPMAVRVAAWRGLVLCDSEQGAEMMIKALGGSDHALELVALKVIRESNDRPLIQACLAKWGTLPPESQLALMDAQVRQGAEALPTVRTASQSPNPPLRVAAWQAMGDLNDLASIPALAQAAVAGDPSERQAARDSLSRLRGPGASEALVAELDRAHAPEKAELLRALGERQDPKMANVLLQNAANGEEPVRIAALESLRKLAPPEALTPLLEIAQKPGSDDQREYALQALSSVCEASPDKEAAARTVVETIRGLPAPAQRAFLPLLPELGTADALATAEAASRSQDLSLAKEAVRALSQWPSVAPAAGLLNLAGATTDPTLQTLALRGAISLAGEDPTPSSRLGLLQLALLAAHQPAEKKQVLGQLGQIPTPDALNVALKAMADPDLSDEASLAVVSIAEKLAKTDPQLADEAAAKVLQQTKGGEFFQRAWALRTKSNGDRPFIRDWVICGPYSRQDVAGAKAIFNIAFGPETREPVQWKTVPPADHINLGTLFPGAQNCAAYLRTLIVVPEDSRGVLLMGSDDGIKAWLNGVVIHSNNTDRGEVTDQDVVPIELKRGANELVLKITQGGGGWSACARIVGPDGNAIAGLHTELPTAAQSQLLAPQN